MSGEAVPHDPTKQYSCEGLRLMHENLASLAELRGRQECLMAEALQLQQDMVDFKENFKKEIGDVLARTPLVIKPRKTKVNIDEDDDSEVASRLPPPLLPQIVGSGGTQAVLNQPMIVCNNVIQPKTESVSPQEESIAVATEPIKAEEEVLNVIDSENVQADVDNGESMDCVHMQMEVEEKSNNNMEDLDNGDDFGEFTSSETPDTDSSTGPVAQQELDAQGNTVNDNGS